MIQIINDTRRLSQVILSPLSHAASLPCSRSIDPDGAF